MKATMKRTVGILRWTVGSFLVCMIAVPLTMRYALGVSIVEGWDELTRETHAGWGLLVVVILTFLAFALSVSGRLPGTSGK